MNVLVKDTTDYMSKTNTLMQNTGEASKYAGSTKKALGTKEHQQISLKDMQRLRLDLRKTSMTWQEWTLILPRTRAGSG